MKPDGYAGSSGTSYVLANERLVLPTVQLAVDPLRITHAANYGFRAVGGSTGRITGIPESRRGQHRPETLTHSLFPYRLTNLE
jgi:hypothetical protein